MAKVVHDAREKVSDENKGNTWKKCVATGGSHHLVLATSE